MDEIIKKLKNKENLTFQEKISLVANTKISVCYNIVHVNPEHIPHIQSYDNWQHNKAFSEVGKTNIMPQFKTRMHEAAISKTLNLVYKDNWNIAEQYYEPDKEFLYFIVFLFSYKANWFSIYIVIIITPRYLPRQLVSLICVVRKHISTLGVIHSSAS